MTLKEKFKNLEDEINTWGTYYDKKVQIADEYAIEFAEWCFINNVYKSETFDDDNLFLCGTKRYDDGTDKIFYGYELLNEFKKEKGYDTNN